MGEGESGVEARGLGETIKGTRWEMINKNELH